MEMRYEYKFVRLDETKPAMFGLDRAPVFAGPDIYQRSIHEHAALGWRLVQIFAPPTSYPGGAPAFYELVFERAASDAEPGTAADPGCI